MCTRCFSTVLLLLGLLAVTRAEDPALSDERVVLQTTHGDVEFGFYPEVRAAGAPGAAVTVRASLPRAWPPIRGHHRPQVAPVTAAHIFKLCVMGAYTGASHIMRGWRSARCSVHTPARGCKGFALLLHGALDPHPRDPAPLAPPPLLHARRQPLLPGGQELCGPGDKAGTPRSVGGGWEGGGQGMPMCGAAQAAHHRPPTTRPALPAQVADVQYGRNLKLNEEQMVSGCPGGAGKTINPWGGSRRVRPPPSHRTLAHPPRPFACPCSERRARRCRWRWWRV